nr:NTP-binding domain [Maize chlorotic dwarf virus]
METINSDANGCFSLGGLKSTAKMLDSRKTCEKFADIMDFTHDTLGVKDGPAAQRLAAAVAQIAPIIESVSRTTESVESKLTCLDKYKDGILGILQSLCKETIPGLAIVDFKKGKYMWATLLTLIAGAALFWACKSQKSFLKRFSVVVMIIWSPFLAGKVWSLGQWIVQKWCHLWPKSDSCRQHSLAGLFESAKTKVRGFPDWFRSGGMNIVTQVCSVLLTIVSLITLGTIPSAKKSKSLADRFIEFGNMNRAATSIAAGYKSISELCSKFTHFVATHFLGATVDDNVFKDLVTFNVKDWVEQVKVASLEENKFKSFGSPEQLTRVRHMYDKSLEITNKLLDRNKVPVAMLPVIRDTCKKCEELLNDSYSYKGMKTPRIDPFYICLTGPPGVGKSTVASIIINDLLDYMGEPKTDRIYTRCCADSYWSNYHHEPVIIYDDLGAISKVASLSDYAEIMGIKSNRPYSLPMAAVEEKGRHCLSKYLVACTNLTHLDDTGDVKTKEAYYRRINLPVTVERDLAMPMSPEDPASGLLFTIGDIHENGRNVSVVESRLLNGRVPFRAGDLRNMSYNYFMEFVRIYATIYMENQQQLVAKLSGDDYESSSSSFPENEELEFDFLAQAHNGVYLTIEEVVAKFESMKFSGKQLNAEIEKFERIGVDGWRTNKALSFNDLVKRFCGCCLGDDCNFDFHYRTLFKVLIENKQIPAYKCMVLHKVNPDRMKTQIKMVNGYTLETMFKTLNPLTIFLYLVFVLKCGISADNVCLSYQLFAMNDAEQVEFEIEDSLRLDEQVQIGQYSCYVWPSVGKFYPEILAKRGCIAVNDGTTFYIFVSSSQIDKIHPEAAWSDMLQGVGRRGVDILSIAGPTKTKFLIKHVESCYETLKSPEDWKAKCKEYYESISLYEYILLLMAVGSRAGIETQRMSKYQARKNKIRMPEVLEKYIEVEKATIGKLSKPAKTCLAIGAGVAIFGVLAGLGVGLYKLITHFSKTDSEDNDIEIDDLVPEMSGAHASDENVTTYAVRRQVPKVRLAKQFKVRSSPSPSDNEQPKVDILVPEMTGCHASDEHLTKHFTKRRVTMKRVGAVKESHIVTYDENTPHVRLIRNLRRTRLARAIKQMAQLGELPDTLSEIQ